MSNQLRDILKLSVTERIILVKAIWDSIAPEGENIQLPEDTKLILDQRLADHQANPETGSNWEEAKARIKRKL